MHFLLPPLCDIAVQRIGSSQAAKFYRCGKIYGQIDLDTIRTENICQSLNLLQIIRRKGLRRSIDIVENSTVNTDRGIGTGIFGISWRYFSRQFVPFPERTSGISALYSSIRIIPVIKDTDVIHRLLLDIQSGAVFTTCLKTEKMIGSIKESGFRHRTQHSCSILNINGITILAKSEIFTVCHELQ